MEFYDSDDCDFEVYPSCDSDDDSYYDSDDHDYIPSVHSIESKEKANKIVLKGSGREFLSAVWEMVQEGPQSNDFQLEFQDGGEMRINSMVLTNMSPYFSAMLSSEMRETVEKKIKLPTVSRMTFTRMLAFTLGQEVELESREELVELLETADMMQMKALVTAGVRVLVGSLTVDNCLETLAIVRRLGGEGEKTAMYIARNMKEISQRDDWCSLEEKDLRSIVNASQSVYTTKSVLIDAVLRWIEGTAVDRSDVIDSVLTATKIADLSPQSIRDMLTTHPSLFKSQIVMDAVQRQIKPKGEITFLVIGSATCEGDACTDTYIYAWSENDQEWFILPPPPENLPEHFAAVIQEDTLYVTGGLSDCPSQKTWIVDWSGWKKGISLRTGRYKHGMELSHFGVYVVGGLPGPLTTIEEWPSRPATAHPSARPPEVCQLQEAVYDSGVGMIGDNLVVVGGSDLQGPKNIIQLFNTSTSTSGIIRPSLSVNSGINMGYTTFVGSLHGAYFMTGSGHLLKAVEEEKSIKLESQVQLKDFDHKSPFVAVLDRGGVVVCDSLAADCRYSLDGEKKEETNIIGRLRNDIKVQNVFRHFLKKPRFDREKLARFLATFPSPVDL